MFYVRLESSALEDHFDPNIVKFRQCLTSFVLVFYSLGPNINLERSDPPPMCFSQPMIHNSQSHSVSNTHFMDEESNAKLEPKAKVGCLFILGFWLANHKKYLFFVCVR